MLKDVIKRCLDNTQPESNYKDLGILYFAREFFSVCRGNEVAPLHYKLMKHALGLLNPNKSTSMDRQCYVIVHRGAAKSTYNSFIYPLYLMNLVGCEIWVREESPGWEGSGTHDYDIFSYTITPEFITLLSETGASAENFAMNIRTELEVNSYLKSVFGDLTPYSIDKDESTGMWRRDAFVTTNQCIVRSRGAGQQVRGLNISGRRPSLLIFDDLYSDKNTTTEQIRDKIRNWFFQSAINSLDSNVGKALLIGTMVHEDTVLTDVQRSEQWYGYKYPIIGSKELDEALAMCNIKISEGKFTLPSIEDINKAESTMKTLSWPDRYPLEWILKKYQQSFEIGKSSYFFQEYLNVLMAPDDIKFHNGMVTFSDIRFWKENDINWVEFTYDKFKWVGVIETYCCIDPASSELSSSDDTAIVVGGITHAYPIVPGFDYYTSQNQHIDKPKGRKFPIVLDSFMGKLDIYKNEYNGKDGMIDIAERLCIKYRCKKLGFEVAGQQGLIARELRKYFQQRNMTTTVQDIPAVNRIGKVDRIESILLPVIQSAPSFIMQQSENSHKIWEQLKYLRKAEHDDGADCTAHVFSIAKCYYDYDYQLFQSDHLSSPLIQEEETVDWECF